ncbi:DUF421 domain-containing protein [Neolewinella litorea]|uniref:DUF421 domain-containing protein n=1 Tax=Neolewinella litorea TaxID=2562452 RepID=A0A4S4NA56_9BACT|nr:YetF domain-containing protein [Neolewinella litorea]THH35545.1 DUF421 domain-containing protein [Neolewinella litorea]
MDFSEMFYQDWTGLLRTLIVGTLGYIFIVFSLRISGNRTLSKLNAFDLAISVAFGSTFASMLLSEDVALAEGMLAIALLCFLQYALAFLSVRSRWFAKLVRSEPVLLVRHGEMLIQAIHDARLTKRELLAVARSHGHRDLSDIDLVILESDGGFSVIGKQNDGANEEEENNDGEDDDSPEPVGS